MADVSSIVVIPADPDYFGLMSTGFETARPPIVWRDSREGVWITAPWRDGELFGLPVWWESGVVACGWDGFMRAMWRATSGGHYFPERLFAERFPNLAAVRLVTQDAVRVGVASRIVHLDSGRREIP